MTNLQIGGGNAYERMAQLKRQMSQASKPEGSTPNGASFPAISPEAASSTSVESVAKEGLGAVESSVQRTNNIHLDVIKGDVDLHEVAAQLKESEITFQFALTVRNKLLDAYREVMRMSV